MVQNAKQMRCGGCGGESFLVYRVRYDDEYRDVVNELFLECQGCKSINTYTATAPALQSTWEGTGGLAVF
jgi:hypothetical protein